MEADFSSKISDFFLQQESNKEKPNKEAIKTALVGVLEGLYASSIRKRDIESIEPLKAIYRRGAASFDHIHMIGVTRMELGIARVIHVIKTNEAYSPVLDLDLLKNDPNCGSWHLDDQQGHIFINYEVLELGLAKVKLTTAGIPEIFRDLQIDIEK